MHEILYSGKNMIRTNGYFRNGGAPMKQFFNGYYYKHQKEDLILSLIVGRTCGNEFIQVITPAFSCQYPGIGNNRFGKAGIHLDIQTPDLTLSGDLRYGSLSPIRYDIMGPFQYFPMECRHGIVSMRHKIEGRIMLNQQELDFTGGTGYIEKDSGCSFPSAYTWIQANDFGEHCAIMAAVANIPFAGIHFQGCICIIQYHGKEIRLATYLGVRVLICSKNKIILIQGAYRLIIDIYDAPGHSLHAPAMGAMTRRITETASCHARFQLYQKNREIFSLTSNHASFEYEM